MDDLFGHPSSGLFLAALSFCLFRWAPAGERKIDRLYFFTFSIVLLFLAIAYLFLPLSGVLGVIACAALLIFYICLEHNFIPGIKVNPSISEVWKKHRIIESSAIIGATLMAMFIWQKL